MIRVMLSSEEHMKEKVRQYYEEFQGYLSQAPGIKLTSDVLYDSGWDQVNQTIDLLNRETGEDFSRFKIQPAQGSDWVRLAAFRNKLGGLVSFLHGKYFSDEPAPFSGMPSSVINLKQEQHTNISFLLEVQSKIDEKISSASDAEEKDFLGKIKDQLASVKNGIELVALVLNLANQMGFDVTKLSHIFH